AFLFCIFYSIYSRLAAAAVWAASPVNARHPTISWQQIYICCKNLCVSHSNHHSHTSDAKGYPILHYPIPFLYPICQPTQLPTYLPTYHLHQIRCIDNKLASSEQKSKTKQNKTQK